MALTTYAGLLSGVAAWLDRGTDLDDRIPDFIRLAEAEFNRRLRTMDMEAAATDTLVSDALALPTDFIGLRSIKINNTTLEYAPPSEIYDDETTGGYPSRYTIVDGQFVFRPAPTSGEVSITYYASIPALTASNTTNWLLTKHPDLYLFAVCAQAEFYLVNDERVAAWKGRAEELIAQINLGSDKERHGGRLKVQHRVGQVRNIQS